MDDISENLLAGWTVLVIDDEEDSLEVAEVILSEYGADVYTASNGKEGLEVLRKVKPTFVISDLSMPVMDGWGFIHALKAERAFADTPVIALTAHAMMGDRERALSVGFHNYLTKPLVVNTFMSKLVKLLIDIPALATQLNS